MSSVIGAVAQSILPKLTEANNEIQSISYMYGPVKEMIETISQKDKSPSERFRIWPAIMLFTDVSTLTSDKPGSYAQVTLQMAIAYPTLPTYKADERYINNFEPILYPLWHELMKQIYESGCFSEYAEKKIVYTKWDRPYWGKNGNMLAQVVDAIELQNLQLNIYRNAKPRIIAPTEQFFDTQFFDGGFFK